jgi:hypothetical protein
VTKVIEALSEQLHKLDAQYLRDKKYNAKMEFINDRLREVFKNVKDQNEKI